MGLFTSTPVRKPKRSNFDLSHEVKLSTEFGRLTPILCEDVVPGDTFKLKTEIFVRLAPMLAPIMHRVNVTTHFFYVPNRLIWDGWKDFITGGPTGEDAPIPPYYNLQKTWNENKALLQPGSLFDYLGFPAQAFTSSPVAQRVSALPFRAYRFIYDEYYRDQNLEGAMEYDKSLNGDVSANKCSVVNPLSGQESYTVECDYMMRLLTRCWEKDYFTSALPWPQRGEDVLLPIQGEAAISVDPNAGTPRFLSGDGQGLPNSNIETNLQSQVMGLSSSSQFNRNAVYDPDETLKVNLDEATSTTVTTVRRAFALQRWFEKNSRSGSRYVEQILSHFGVRVPDYRIDRPVYLGGGKSPVVISEVLQQSQSEGSNPLGTMGGHGASLSTTHQFKYRFPEHGWVIGILSITPRSSYQNGWPRKFSRFDKFDYLWPEFQHIGEQPILNQELYFNANQMAPNNGTFGYQSRYSEYKFINSSVHGDMRDTLQFWHLGRNFDKLPGLNADFVHLGTESKDSLNRIFNTSGYDGDHFWIQIFTNLKAKRPLSYYSEPI